MKFEILSAVMVTNPFCRFNRRIGLVLSGNDNYYEVSFFDERSVFSCKELVKLPNFYKLGSDNFLIVCAWCKDRNQDEEKKLIEAGVKISHGICPDCRINFGLIL
jgi:hypothetical protein